MILPPAYPEGGGGGGGSPTGPAGGELSGIYPNPILDKTAITNKAEVTPVSGDKLLISDGSDGGNLKEVDASNFLGGGGATNLSYNSGTREVESDTGTNALLPIVVPLGIDGLMNGIDKDKLDNIEPLAEVNVNSDWNAVSGDALILNKPTGKSYVTVAPSGADYTTWKSAVEAGETDIYVTATVTEIANILVPSEAKIKTICSPGSMVQFGANTVTFSGFGTILQWEGTENTFSFSATSASALFKDGVSSSSILFLFGGFYINSSIVDNCPFADPGVTVIVNDGAVLSLPNQSNCGINSISRSTILADVYISSQGTSCEDAIILAGGIVSNVFLTGPFSTTGDVFRTTDNVFINGLYDRTGLGIKLSLSGFVNGVFTEVGSSINIIQNEDNLQLSNVDLGAGTLDTVDKSGGRFLNIISTGLLDLTDALSHDHIFDSCCFDTAVVAEGDDIQFNGGTYIGGITKNGDRICINGATVATGKYPVIEDIGKVKIADSAVEGAMNLTTRSIVPTTPVTGDIYLDDGTNTASGNSGWRRYTGAVWEDISAAGGAGSTNLGYTASATDGTVTSDTGTNATLPLATPSGGTNNAGLLSPTDKDKVDNTSGTNTGDEVQATETVSGKVELATQVETDAGTDDTRTVTPLKLSTVGFAKKSAVNNYTKQQYFGEQTLVDAANIAWNVEDKQATSVTLTANRIIDNPTNMVAGGTYILRVIQGGLGSFTLSFGAAYVTSDDSSVAFTRVLSTAVGSFTTIAFYSDGSKMISA